MILTGGVQYNRILKQRDETIIQQADEIAELRDELAEIQNLHDGLLERHIKLGDDYHNESHLWNLAMLERDIAKAELTRYKNLFHKTELEVVEIRQDWAIAATEAEQLRAELAENINAMGAAGGVIDELRGELAAIKPSWDDAPDWAK